MWLAFDIETYELYDGTKKSQESIVQDMITENDKKRFLDEKKEGYYYPVLNSRKFALGCAVTDQGEKVAFYDEKKLLDWLIKKIESNAKNGEKTYIYGHNIEYDFLGIVKDKILDLLNDKLELISESPFLASWKIKGKNWGFFVDSYAFFRNMSVEKIGKIIGYEKMEMPLAVKDLKEIEMYCMRDSEIVLKAMMNLKEKLEVLGFKPRKFLTAGQVAMSSFLSFIRKENTHWNIMKSGEVYKGENLEKCRPAYRGGRNEAFVCGKVEDVTYLDINSLYPYAMSKMPFPKLNEEMYVEDPLKKGLSISEILDKKFVGVAECEIEVPEIEVGYLGIRLNGLLYFPEGKRIVKGTWTTLELRRAESLGYVIKEVNWVCLYPVIERNVFEGYVKKLYKLRKDSDEEMNLAVKLIMNNLYGKFAQFRVNKEFRVIYREEFDSWKKKGWKVKSVWGAKYIIEKYNEIYVPKYTNLLIAILITAWARDYMYSFLRQIKKEDLVYMDTDSILIKNYESYKKIFEISDEIGKWKIVGENQEGFIKGEKDYRIGNDVKASGVGKRVLSEIDFDNVNELVQKRRIGIKDALREPGEFLNRLGSFRDFKIEFKNQGKRMNNLPLVIDERKEWVNIFD